MKWQEELTVAKDVLSHYGGEIKVLGYDYEAFRYVSPSVTLIFYPHKTSAGNYHLRVRSQHSKDKKLAEALMRKLDKAAGYNCTFSRHRI